MRADEKVFMAYFESRSARLYYSRLKELTNLSHSSLQNALQKLTSKGLLKEEKEKSNIFYVIKDDKKIALKFSEIAVQKFEELNVGVKSPLREFLNDFPHQVFCVILFGSASKKQETRDSDIDLLVVCHKECDFTERKKKASTISKYPLSIFQCSVEQFIDNEDHVIIQARTTGFPIYGEQHFYEVEINEYT
jgi:predicted nucleotidyltransferase/predicted transcriptional regulator